MKKTLILVLLSGLGLGVGWWSLARSEERASKLTTVTPRKMADSLHAVIAADRAVYARVVVQRLSVDENRVATSEDWETEKCLPVPAQLLRLGAESIQRKGAEFSYVLRSLWPINPKHGPQTQAEQTGLEYLLDHPGTNYYTEEILGGRSYFTAIYPDRATLPSCVSCHNKHPRSPKQDFRPDDVMGGIVVRVPLEF